MITTPVSTAKYRLAWVPSVLGGMFKGIGYSFAAFNFWALVTLGQIKHGFVSAVEFHNLWTQSPFIFTALITLSVLMFISAWRVSIGMEGKGLFVRLLAWSPFAKLAKDDDSKLKDERAATNNNTEERPYSKIIAYGAPFLCAFAKGTAAGFGVWCALDMFVGVPGVDFTFAVLAGIGIFSISAFKEGRRFLNAARYPETGEKQSVNAETGRETKQSKFNVHRHIRHAFGLVLAILGAVAKGFSDNWGAIAGVSFYAFGVSKMALVHNPYAHFIMLMLIPAIVTVSLAMEGKGTIKAFDEKASSTPRYLTMGAVTVAFTTWAVMSLPVSLGVRLGAGLGSLIVVAAFAGIFRQYVRRAGGASNAVFAFLVKGANMAFGTAGLCQLAGASIPVTIILMCVAGLFTGMLTAKEGTSTWRLFTGQKSEKVHLFMGEDYSALDSARIEPTMTVPRNLCIEKLQPGNEQGRSRASTVESTDTAVPKDPNSSNPQIGRQVQFV